jgi:hypothetical protein
VRLITPSLSDQPISRAAFDNGHLVNNCDSMVTPGYNMTKKRLKKIPSDLESSISMEVKALLHACRDCLRNQGRLDTTKVSFAANDGYYGEAFGMMRTLQIQGYGYFGSDNLNGLRESEGSGASADGKYITNVTQAVQNLKWWFSRLCNEVLVEEGFRSDHRCDYCLEKYKKDTASILEKEAARGLVEEA